MTSFPPQSCPFPPIPSCLVDIWHDLQYDPVLCYPQEPRDGLESACTPEQESLPLKIVIFLGFYFFAVHFFYGFFFLFLPLTFRIHSAFLNNKTKLFCLSF